MATTTSKQWTHGCYVRNDFGNQMVVKEKIITIDNDTRKIVDIKNRLTVNDPSMKNPKRKIFITKPQFRNHKYKKETEELSKVDMHIVEDRLLVDKLKEIMGIPAWQRTSLKKICNSPYIYNADVGMEALVRLHYNNTKKHPITSFTTGALDIEASVLGCKRINIFTFIHENTIFTAVLDDFMYKRDEKGNRVKATKRDIYECISARLGKMPDDNHINISSDTKKFKINETFNFELEVFEHELELIFWIFKNIHKMETDFIGIWNMDYDVPKIMERLEYYGVDPKEVFCHPSVPKQWKHLKYHKDRKQTQHISDKWHWLHCTSMSQILDQMLLYARIRKAKRKQSSYKLNDIATEELGISKLGYDDPELEKKASDHRYMQTEKFVEYVAYNIVDALLLVFMERKNHDMVAMWNLTADSPLSDFSKQSVMLKNGYYKFGLEHGRVFATVGEDMSGPYDSLLGKVGGAVLRADQCREIGRASCRERV